MTTLQIKNKLISKIKSTEDKTLLEVVYRLLDLEADDSKPVKLSAGQKASILKGQKQISEGKFFTNKEVDDEIEKWLNK